MTSNLLENTTKGLVQHQVWTNSTVCLNWPQEGVKYKQLVSNRVKKINEKKYTWRYVPTEDNPADIGNRGGSNLQANNKWMKGPTWLGTPELWPAMIVTEPSKNSDSEKQLVKEIMQVSVEREVDVIDERETWRAGVRVYENERRRFEHLLNLVAPFIKKKKCNSRRTISPAEQLAVTIRYLALGIPNNLNPFTSDMAEQPSHAGRYSESQSKPSQKLFDGIVKACLCLHNDASHDNAKIPSGFLDSESTNGDIEFGDWRNMVSSNSAFKPISTGKTFNSSADAAKSTRRAFTTTFTALKERYLVNSVGNSRYQVHHTHCD
eukprot:gene6589-7333_t